ncbi:MAG: hypothetical protein ACQEWF_22140 [Bacillota bacterium]
MYILSELNKAIIRLTESISFLLVGFISTVYLLKPIYESFGIDFMGNVWVNWFGFAYILFVLYTLIMASFILKESDFFQQRLSSVTFWLFFVAASFVVFAPFIKGENPF